MKKIKLMIIALLVFCSGFLTFANYSAYASETNLPYTAITLNADGTYSDFTNVITFLEDYGQWEKDDELNWYINNVTDFSRGNSNTITEIIIHEDQEWIIFKFPDNEDLLLDNHNLYEQSTYQNGGFNLRYTAELPMWLLGGDGYYYYNFKRVTEASLKVYEFPLDKEELVEYYDEKTNEWKEIPYYLRQSHSLKLTMMPVLFSKNKRIWLNSVDENNTMVEYLVLHTATNRTDITRYKGLRKINPFNLPGESNVPIENLPATETTPEIRLGNVYFTYNGTNLTTQINYSSQVYYFNSSFAANTDMTLFDTSEAYYMNIDGQPQIIINHSDRLYLKDILIAPEDEKPTFIPHSTWDLKSNEIDTIHKYNTYAYIKQSDRGQIISYVYIDEFVIDNLLTASVSWTERKAISWPVSIFKGKYTDWQFNRELLASDDYLKYRDLTTNWQMFVPFWSLYYADKMDKTFYEMPRIDSVNFNNIQSEYNVTKSELENHFRVLNTDFDKLKDNPRYKVWAFALQEGVDALGVQTEIYHNRDDIDDPLNFKIMELTYKTNGKLYNALGSDMDLFIKLEPSIDGVWKEANATDWKTIIMIAVILIPYIMIMNANHGFKKFDSFIKITVIYIIVVMFALWFYHGGFTTASIILRL